MEVALGHRHSREIAGHRSGHKMTHKVGGGGGLGGGRSSEWFPS